VGTGGFSLRSKAAGA